MAHHWRADDVPPGGHDAPPTARTDASGPGREDQGRIVGGTDASGPGQKTGAASRVCAYREVIGIRFGRAVSLLGTRTVRTPSASSAVMAAESTSLGSVVR